VWGIWGGVDLGGELDGGDIGEIKVEFAIFVLTLLAKGDADVLKAGLRIGVLRLVVLSVGGEGMMVKTRSVMRPLPNVE
jgi:hypothetical protein